MKFSSIFTPLFSLILLFLIACNGNQRQIVPYEVDAEQVFKAIEPNDDSSPENLTFGKDKIPGFIFDHDFTSENSEIFLYFQNLTILDVNSDINQNIFEFIHRQLSEGGFISDSLSLEPNAFELLQTSGSTYAEASAQLLDVFNKGFEAQYDSISVYNSPFNIYFQIYPVYLDNNYVTYRQYSYSYTGGAHGITASFLKTFDLQTGKEVTIDDIIKPEGLQELHEEVAAHMAYSYPIYENIETVNEYIDSLNVWLGNFSGDEASGNDAKITISNFPLPNPGVLENGLAFIYQMYSMAPGSDGCPLVVIPYHDIKGCLNPKFAK